MEQKPNQHLFKVFSYLAVGGVAFIADNGMFYVLFKNIETSLFLATSIAMTVGFILSFLGNKLLVFADKDQIDAHQTYRQLINYCLLFIFNIIFSYLFIKIIGYFVDSAVLLKVIAALLIVIWNFTIYKKFVFKKV